MSPVLVTGAGGMLGRGLVAALTARGNNHVVATDLRLPAQPLPGVQHAVHDVRAPGLAALLRAQRIEVVVHLASIVTPQPGQDRRLAWQVDVQGTENVLQACLEAGVRRIVVSSSGAAYGYHADNPQPLTEDCALRGNEAFAYAHHKRLVEEMLARWRHAQPTLEQVVLRIGTILGPTVDNQITALFERARPLAIRGSASPFVFVWDADLIEVLLHAMAAGPAGVYNVAGDGVLTLAEIAERMGKRCRTVPAWLLRAALGLARPLGLTRYGPEQIDFLRWRPVLDNTRLKTVFGVHPRHSSAQAFDRWWSLRCPSSPSSRSR